MYSANGTASPPVLDPQALQSTPTSFSRRPIPPNAPRLPRFNDDPPLLMDEDPPAQIHTATSYIDLPHQIQLTQDPGPSQLHLPPQQPPLQQPQQQLPFQDQIQAPGYPPINQVYGQFDQQMQYGPVSQDTFFQSAVPSSFYQSPQTIQYANVYQHSYNQQYSQSFNSNNYMHSLSIERSEAKIPPSWDRPAEQHQLLLSYQLTPLTLCEFYLHISSQIEEIRNHNNLECIIDDIQAQVYQFPSSDLSSSDRDDITVDSDQQAFDLVGSDPYSIQESQMKLETQMAKLQQDKEDQDKMINEKKRLRAEQREQRRAARRASRKERKQFYIETMRQKHEKNLRNFALRFSNLASPSLTRNIQSNIKDTHECIVTIDKSTKIYNSNAWSETSHRFRNMVVGNGYGRVFWPGYIELEKVHGASTVNIGLFGLEIDGFLNNKDIFFAAHTEIPRPREQNTYVQEIEDTIKNIPGMQFCGCDVNNGVFYAFKSQH